jgi:O-antigen biosynthesis protein WbqP
LGWHPQYCLENTVGDIVHWYTNELSFQRGGFYNGAKRVFDLLIAFVLLCVMALPMFIISLLVKVTSKGPIIHRSERVGKDNVHFTMYKFRSMRLGAPNVATHLLDHPKQYVTPVGCFLRKFSLDELPNLLNIFRADMSFVGPRPALFNQDDLVRLRTARGVHRIIPGMTGWAQVHGRDELSIPVKVQYDEYYLRHRSLWLDMKILFGTIFYALSKKGISH